MKNMELKNYATPIAIIVKNVFEPRIAERLAFRSALSSQTSSAERVESYSSLRAWSMQGWRFEMSEAPTRIMMVQVMQISSWTTGYRSAISFPKYNLPSFASCTAATWLGLASCWKNMLKTKPPTPYPERMTPVAKPFRPGRWLHPALNVVAYVAPLSSPKPVENAKMNI